MNTNTNEFRKGQTVIVNGKVGVVAGVARSGAVLVKHADGTQSRSRPAFVTPA